MADEVDRAAQEVEMFVQSSLNRLRERINPQSRRHTTDCEDCGEPISAERLEVLPNAARCIHCQQELENFQRLHV